MKGQMSFFDGQHKFVNDKPIRLIELFGGYGSQALALKYLGVPFEHWCLSEWAVKSIQAYKDMHNHDDRTDYSKELTVEQVRKWLYGRISSDYNTPMTNEQINRLSEKQVRTIYNNMQASHNVGSITQITATDLNVVDTDKFTYIMTYSFPCQDLSQAGQGKGMTKDSGTRSGLLWEVERLLTEMTEKPQILLMENVPQVVGSTGIKDFAKWIERLERFGYKNYWQCLNAKDYGIPQNRNRCFMVSLLGDYFYSFPNPVKLQVRLKDFLDKKVDEKYYLSDKTVEMFIEHTRKQREKGNGFKFEPTNGGGIGKAITTRAGARTDDNFIKEQCAGVMLGRIAAMRGRNPENPSDRTAGSPTEQRLEIGSDETSNTLTTVQKDNLVVEPTNYRFFEQAFETLCENDCEAGDTIDAFNKRVNKDGVSPTITTRPDGFKTAILPITQDYRIRKLTEKECGRLMGVKNEDCEKIAKNQSTSSQYHLYGDSIAVPCLMAIFGELFSVDYNDKINSLTKELRK